LTHVAVMEIATSDNMLEGDYQFIVRSIEMRGKWISHTLLLSLILGLWALSGLIYLMTSFWQARAAVQAMRLQKNELQEVNAALELERKELKLLATHDPLTGVNNRVGLRNYLYEQVSLVKQHKSLLSVIFMDIDNFKQINDQYGHDDGDKVLKSFADFIVERTRAQDFFCRWGGEEFLLLCPDAGLGSAALIAEKLRELIERQSWPHGQPLTCSFGVAQMQFYEEVSRFLKRADEALYRAKQAGRNRVMTGSDLNEHAR
jgi:diguanylate cyclase (GGDEF)-like protein